MPKKSTVGYVQVTSPIQGGKTGIVQIHLYQPAPPGGAAISLQSSNTKLHVPAHVTIPAGSTSALLVCTADPVAHKTPFTVSAQLNPPLDPARGFLTPASPANSVAFTVPVRVGVTNTTNSVHLNPPASAGETVVFTKQSGSGDAAFPNPLPLNAGDVDVTFNVTGVTTGSVNVVVKRQPTGVEIQTSNPDFTVQT